MMEKLEAKAFACWKVDVTDTYKRQVIEELYGLISKESNQTTGKLYKELSKSIWNVTKVEVDCALASLKVFDVIGIFRIRADETGESANVNCKRFGDQKWKKYQEYCQSLQPA